MEISNSSNINNDMMQSSTNTVMPVNNNAPLTEEEESDDDDEGMEEVLEESPCGRYHKRKERVTQRDVPGIDAAYLAMDTDYAVQVVWNEVIFSQRKSAFKPHAASIKQVFDNLMLIDHPNIIKVHKYWTTENKDEKPRLIFITEYMPSRNIRQFLKTTRSQTQKQMNLKVWKRWCIQILYALTYLHSVDPPIIHGNLNCETLFIQHNGLLKIGSIAPDAIHTHVKTCKDQTRHFHFIAPEYANSDQPINEAVDIYAFGMCALEMAVHGLITNSDSTINDEFIDETMKTLQPDQAEFIRSCIAKTASERPSAHELLFQPIIFEVHQLKLLAAHAIIQSDLHLQDDLFTKYKRNHQEIFATIPKSVSQQCVQWSYGMFHDNDVEKLLEDVSNGLFPLTNYVLKKRPPEKVVRVSSPEENIDTESGAVTCDGYEPESRLIVTMSCDLQKVTSDACKTPPMTSSAENLDSVAAEAEESEPPAPLCETVNINLKLKLDDNTTRNLSAQFTSDESFASLSCELVQNGFINEIDREKVADLISNAYNRMILSC